MIYSFYRALFFTDFQEDLTSCVDIRYYRYMDESARSNDDEKLLEAPHEEQLLDQPAEEKLIPAHTSHNSKGLLVKVLLGLVGALILFAVLYTAVTFVLAMNTTPAPPELPIETHPTEAVQADPTLPPPVMPGEDPQPACTMEAKLCPDGSSVGRSGPNCEFAACPPFQNE